MAYTSGSIINFDRFNDTEEIQRKAMESAAQGGPNSGFEIDGAELFRDGLLANEFPDMKDDIALIISSEAYVSRLVDFHRRIHENRGMSRGMAYELKELVPSLENFNPLQYTEDVTSIGVEPSLEAISAKVWALIAAGIVFVVGLIYKFVKWIFGKDTGAASLGDVEDELKAADVKVADSLSSAEKTRKVLHAVGGTRLEAPLPSNAQMERVKNSRLPDSVKAVVEAETKRHDALDTPQEERKIIFRLSEALLDPKEGSVVARYVTDPPRLARILYNNHNSDVIRSILSAFEAFRTGAPLIAANLELVDDLMGMVQDDHLPTEPGALAKFQGQLSTIDEMLTENKSFEVGGHKFASMGAWAVDFKNTVNDPKNVGPGFRDLEDFLEAHYQTTMKLKGCRFDQVVVFIKLLQKAEPTLERLITVAKKQEVYQTHVVDASRAKRHSEISSRATRVASLLSNNMRALMVAYQVLGEVYHEVTYVGASVVKRIHSNAHHIVRYYENAGVDAPSELVSIVEQLEIVRKRAEAAIISQNLAKTDLLEGVRHIGVKPRVSVLRADGTGEVQIPDDLVGGIVDIVNKHR